MKIMSRKLNCWEFRNCGMEPGGIFSEIYGVCPIARTMKYDGVNGGLGAGRACWVVMNKSAGKGPFICRNNRQSCYDCGFYKRVRSEENSRVPAQFGQRPIEKSKFILS